MMIFIVGVGRSGTSLLQSMLASHSAVVALPETSFLRRYVFSAKVNDNLVDKHLDRIPQLRTIIDQQCTKVIDYEKVYKTFIGQVNSGFVLDKDPRLIEYMAQLDASFSACKIIHIYRDPRDVLLSKKKAEWSSGRHLISYLIASRVQLFDAGAAENTIRSFYSLKYENLIAQPQFELERLCKFAELKFEKGMLEYGHAANQLVNENEMAWKKETLQPLMKNNSSKWRQGITNIEALSSFYNVQEFCNKNGYLMDLSEFSFFEKLTAKSIVVLTALLTIAYRVHRRLIRKS